ncbi:PEP-utilizing enzyme [Polyangium sp. y55x31]|uniref:PEP-utilizing enzyme n=1 Tax=Polyangium sp. y55x31 TaxID=3042688 RepID=UPI00248214F7|nr:PEP-utilizing enzyme [Polyangium sp. y55x31]MDI1482971.1 PEP-utilizing enzyme [Polyangium sp. y55x31]
MKTHPMFPDLKFEPPGPGPWELEKSHFIRPSTRFGAEVMARGVPRGFTKGMERYGLLMARMNMVPVNGFGYAQMVPYGVPEGGGGGQPPPKAVLWLLFRLHPGIRARIQKCQRAFETKLWRADLERWDRSDKPRAIAQNRALQAIDPASLDLGKLRDLVRRVRWHMEDMATLHHEYNIAAILPTGDYTAHTCEWTGASTGEVLALLQGTSPLARGIAIDELEALGKALRASEEGRAVLAGKGDPQGVLDALVAVPGEVGAAARGYLDLVRYRSIGYDIADKTAGELPDMLVRAIRAVIDRDLKEKEALAARDAKERELRARVPAAHRAQFDELLGEARLVNRLRDERGIYADSWGTGLARRAVLEVGRRLAAAGKIGDPELAVDLTMDEMFALLDDREGPSAEELAKRALYRATMTLDHAPAWLNAPPGEPPPLDVFPAPARRAMKAMNVLMADVFQEHAGPKPEEKDTVVRVAGLSINAGAYEGTARVVLDPADFGRIQKGDVLVTRSTSAYFNVVLPLLGAIVTDRGGQLSHAAIVAREYGIPGIVGTKEATTTIPDGALVRVDGEKGEVTVLAAAPAVSLEVAT